MKDGVYLSPSGELIDLYMETAPFGKVGHVYYGCPEYIHLVELQIMRNPKVFFKHWEYLGEL